MKTKPTTKQTPMEWVSGYAKMLKAEEGIAVPGFRPHSEDPKVRRIYWRRAAMVQAAYDNAPAGAEAIAAAVWRKLQSFRPKLTAWGLDELVSSCFRMDVSGILYGKVSQIRSLERKAEEAADDARRAKRMKEASKSQRRPMRRAA